MTSELHSPVSDRPSGTFAAFARRYPDLARLHQETAEAAEEAGPLDARTRFLIKIGIAMGAGLESAVRSHARRAMRAGASAEEIEQAVLLGMTTCGFPRSVAAWSWVQQQFERDRAGSAGGEAP